jgi:hypothetical protein
MKVHHGTVTRKTGITLPLITLSYLKQAKHTTMKIEDKKKEGKNDQRQNNKR